MAGNPNIPGDPRRVRFKHAHHPRYSETFRLGDGPALIGDEDGGWSLIDRPDDMSATEWTGGRPLRIGLPLTFDGWRRRENVADDIRKLRELLGPRDRDEEPLAFNVYGPVPFTTNRRFVIESITYDEDSVIRDKGNGEILRQDLVVNLLEFVPADRIRIRRKKTYRCERGDTCLKIAHKLYNGHFHKRARKIADMNDIRSIRKRLKKGRVLRVP